ncbi:hypothetical protein FB390_2714 [Nocardia bhagyanarayanae]|uniref:Ig-like domain-containing protein n=2 Tax=Nocardia bhagyanarayanae TaxID=1215925 RepID=A0A543FB55_9NOCA|nr:hypothetical protein FB390_2714 [Nocardia bhagyanarayanae]
MKSSWMAVPLLLVVAVSGCSGDTSADTAATSTVAPAKAAGTSTVAAPRNVDSAGGVDIPLGEKKSVPVPADAIMEIKVPAAWGTAVDSVRCAVTDSNGRNEDLRSSEPKKQEDIAGEQWITLWTFSSPPATEVTVGCVDADNAVTAAELRYIRVVPRGLAPS